MAEKVTISLPEEIKEAVDDQLEYGDSRSGWIQEAIEQRLRDEGIDPDSLGNLKAVPTAD